MIGKKVIIRGINSGVFFGTLAEKNGSEVRLHDCRRLWYWEGAASISQIAVEGVKEPDACKFTVSVPDIIITDAVEIIACSDYAVDNISGVKEWKI